MEVSCESVMNIENSLGRLHDTIGWILKDLWVESLETSIGFMTVDFQTIYLVPSIYDAHRGEGGVNKWMAP